MRRAAPLTAAGLLGLALLAPMSSVSAAGETCRGEAATHVGTGPTLIGTEGRDVIVTGTASVVNALGGDDVICVSRSVASPNLLDLDAGAGNDFVDATAPTTDYSGRVTLGPGSDAFTGSAARDVVYTGATPDPEDLSVPPGSDTDTDRVDTWEGADLVVSGSAGAASHDVVALGADDDALYLASAELAVGALMAGADGDDRLRFGTGTGDATLDQTLGTLTTAAGTATVASFEAITVEAGPGTLTYRGSPGNDSITVHPVAGTPTLDLATAAGQDHIVVEPATIAAGSTIDGGTGRNKLVAANRSGSMEIDLEQGRLLVDGRLSTVANLQDATFYVPEVTMTGNSRGNILAFSGCAGVLTGGNGRDQLLNVYDGYFESYGFDCRARTTMSGGAAADRIRGGQGGDRLFGGNGSDTIEGRGGNDRIRGNAGPDELDGGEGRDDIRGGSGRDTLVGRPGRDTLVGQGGSDSADGKDGRDRCIAEREQHCER